MKLYKGMDELEKPYQSAVITIGNFDGLHLGHQALIQQTVSQAKKIGAISVVITFRPHPQLVLRPTTGPHLINTYDEKIELISHLGVDVLVEEPFSREFSNTNPEGFIDDLIHKIGLRVLYLGYDFAFGKERAGSVTVLKEIAAKKGVEIHVLPATKLAGKAVSSSSVRGFLEAGKMDLVSKYLGRPFFLRGLVWRGEGRGRTIGVPTANLRTENRVYPKVGVYASKTLWRNQWYLSVSNIGFNPTFRENSDDFPLKVETHLFDFSQDMYGDEIQVNFIQFLREEKKFSSVNALMEQIHKDFAEARNVLAKADQ
jgi:riboflavin kinase/FMN adenylyltransferase